MASASSHRLPRAVTPRRYDLHVRCRPDRDRFDGEVAIHVDVHEATDRVELHGDDLTIHAATVEAPGGEAPAEVELAPADDLVVLTLPRALEPGEATVRLRYEGKVHKDMLGLYLSTDGERTCLATQCEATAARRILPCFDEPSFKATFRLEVTTGPGLTVLANERLEAREEAGDGEGITWRFQPTRPISSYLLAFSVGDFAATNEAEARDTPFKVWALGGQEDLGEHARDFAAELLPWYEDYFQVPYPYGKYDQLAVPAFSFGAMENAGLVLFRPSLLLMAPETTSWDEVKRIDNVVSHEFAHMWFGNHVTMAWWDDLWLNEAFAEWIAHKSVDDLRPGHQMWFDFKRRTDAALDTDALASTHAIYAPVESPAEAEERFDMITYGKGSAVMRMLEAYLGADAFRAGLRQYMADFAEANARGEDLWTRLADASGEPVERVMGAWIRTPGHPVIHAALGDDGALRLRQERFLLDPGAADAPGGAEGADRWPVPLVLRTPAGEERVLLDVDEATVDVGGARSAPREGEPSSEDEGGAPWVVANAGDLGFYRVRPDGALLDALQAAWDDLTPEERAGLLRDEWDLVRAGARDVRRYLDLLGHVTTGEGHHFVVERLAGQARALQRILETRGEEEALQGLAAWARARFRPAFEALPWGPEPLDDPAEGARRATVLQAMAVVGEDPEAIRVARDLAARERDDPGSVDANLAGVAVHVAARFGDGGHLDAHLEELEARRGAASPQALDRYVYGLAHFREPALVDRVLGLVRAQALPQQSVGPLLRLMLSTPHGGPAAWGLLKEELDMVRETQGGPWVANLVERAGDLPPRLRGDVELFFAQGLGAEEAVESRGRALEALRVREAFHKRVADDLAAWARRQQES